MFASVPILAAFVVIFECGVFHPFVPVNGTPLATCDSVNQTIKYLPIQSCVQCPDRDRRRPVTYAINGDGWNSAHAQCGDARRRIAIVGDSSVEALQVNPAESVSARPPGDPGLPVAPHRDGFR